MPPQPNDKSLLNKVKAGDNAAAKELLEHISNLDISSQTQILNERDHDGNSALILTTNEDSLAVPILKQVARLDQDSQKAILKPNCEVPKYRQHFNDAKFYSDKLHWHSKLNNTREHDYVSLALFAITHEIPVVEALADNIADKYPNSKAFKTTWGQIRNYVQDPTINQQIHDCNESLFNRSKLKHWAHSLDKQFKMKQQNDWGHEYASNRVSESNKNKLTNKKLNAYKVPYSGFFEDCTTPLLSNEGGPSSSSEHDDNTSDNTLGFYN